ncbi:MAG: ABC transporter substrate-binding protein [Deltaproteobacteria bacterium]|nr:ABC transporter substrate-binding protein [Deltaproteobacteria bacterium]
MAILAACTPNRRRTPDDTLVMAIETPMNAADPRYTISNYDAKLGKLIAPGLTSVDTPDAMPRMELAASIDRVDPLTVDVTLADRTFSDGQPVTANDVVRTYQSVMADECNSLYQKGFLERYASIEALDDKHVRFHTKQPIAMFASDVEFGIISWHGVKPGECHPPLVGAGPYTLRELTSQHALLDANPHYPTRPKLPHVEIKFVRDDAARMLMMAGGSVDILQNTQPDLVDDIAERPRVKLAAGPSVLLTYMLLNNEDKVLRDHRVREAIALALDRPTLVAAKFGGRAVMATGLLPPLHWAYTADVPHYTRDLSRAKQLLDEAGYKPGPDGIRLRLTYKTSSVPFRVGLARALAAQLGDVGIAVEVRPFEFATFFADIKKGNYEIATMQSSEIAEPDFYYFYFHSSRIPDAKDPDGGNRWRYRNAEVDRLTLAGRTELDRDKRKAIYAQVQRIVAEDLPIIPLWHEDNVALSNVDVQGYTIVPNARFVGLIGASKSP